MEFSHLGSSLALRSVARLGAALSLFGISRIGSSLSVLDFTNLGSSLSLRSFSRLGASLSVCDFAHFGSSLSVRSLVRFGSDIQAFKRIEFVTANNYIVDRGTDELDFVVGGEQVMRMFNNGGGNVGGKLFGTWESETSITSSDRKLKKKITPLASSLRAMHPSFDGAKKIKENEEPREKKESVTGWVLRQLRPVSYYFKKNEAKQMRFGFIADEMEQVLPDVVREIHVDEPKNATQEEKKEPYKGIVYGDLIAVLTDAIKDVSSQMNDMRSRMMKAEIELDRLDREDPMDDDDQFV